MNKAILAMEIPHGGTAVFYEDEVVVYLNDGKEIKLQYEKAGIDKEILHFPMARIPTSKDALVIPTEHSNIVINCKTGETSRVDDIDRRSVSSLSNLYIKDGALGKEVCDLTTGMSMPLMSHTPLHSDSVSFAIGETLAIQGKDGVLIFDKDGDRMVFREEVHGVCLADATNVGCFVFHEVKPREFPEKIPEETPDGVFCSFYFVEGGELVEGVHPDYVTLGGNAISFVDKEGNQAVCDRHGTFFYYEPTSFGPFNLYDIKLSDVDYDPYGNGVVATFKYEGDTLVLPLSVEQTRQGLDDFAFRTLSARNTPYALKTKDGWKTHLGFVGEADSVYPAKEGLVVTKGNKMILFDEDRRAVFEAETKGLPLISQNGDTLIVENGGTTIEMKDGVVIARNLMSIVRFGEDTPDVVKVGGISFKSDGTIIQQPKTPSMSHER